MKRICLSLLAIATCSACSTTLYSNSGKPVLRTFGDVKNLHYKSKEQALDVESLDHSTPTRAAGETVARSVQATATGAAGVIAAGVARGVAGAAVR